MNIPIPKEIKCGGHTYTVRFAEHLHRDLLNRAEVLFHTHEIKLDNQLPIGIIAPAFLHEVIHVIDRCYCNTMLSEDATNQLAEGLYQVLQSMGINFVKEE